MAKQKFTIEGTENKTYNLDEISNDNRENADKPLIVQVYTYTKGQNPNPKNLKIGQLWVSKRID